MIPPITEDEIAALELCQSREDWDNACDAIKLVRGGAYPPDWWHRVKMSGRMDRILSRWGAGSALQIKRIEIDRDQTEEFDG